MEQFSFCVNQKRQFTSGADYIVRYRAELDPLTDSPEIEIVCVSTYPEDADAKQRQIALEYISRGIGRVLQSLAVGARVRVYDLVIHPVDFSARKFEDCTAEHLAAALKGDV